MELSVIEGGDTAAPAKRERRVPCVVCGEVVAFSRSFPDPMSWKRSVKVCEKCILPRLNEAHAQDIQDVKGIISLRRIYG